MKIEKLSAESSSIPHLAGVFHKLTHPVPMSNAGAGLIVSSAQNWQNEQVLMRMYRDDAIEKL